MLVMKLGMLVMREMLVMKLGMLVMREMLGMRPKMLAMGPAIEIRAGATRVTIIPVRESPGIADISLVLALDTTTRAGSVAVTRDDSVLALVEGDATRTHAEKYLRRPIAPAPTIPSR